MNWLLGGIGRRIFISFAILLLVLLSILSVGVWKYLEDSSAKNAANELRVQSITLVQQLQRYLTRLETSIRVLGNDGGRLDEWITLSRSTARHKILDSLGRRKKQSSLFEDYYVFTTDGQLLARTEPNWPVGPVGNQAFFQNGLKKVTFSDVFESPVSDEVVLLVSGPIGDPKNPVGVLVGKVRLEVLYDLMEAKLGLSTSAEAFVLDSQLRFVTPSSTKNSDEDIPTDLMRKSHLASTPLVEHLNEEFWVGRYQNFRGDDVLGTVRKIQGYDGFLVIEKPFDEIQKEFQFIKRTIIVSMVGLLIALMVASILITRTITKSLQDLTAGMRRIARGDLNEKISIPRVNDEVRILAEEFEGMREKILSYQLQLETKLEDSERRRIENERLASIGTLAASLAHEIRNPLNGISLLISQMEMTPERDKDDLKVLEVLRGEILRLDRLVTEILSFARPLKLEMRPGAIQPFFDQIAATISAQAIQNKIQFIYSIDTQAADVELDWDRLKQAILNLTQNAFEAIQGISSGVSTGSSVTSSTTPILTPRIELIVETRLGALEIFIRDTGVGISESDRSRVFDLFFSTKEMGTGFGLSTVKKIIDAHRGEISVKSPLYFLSESSGSVRSYGTEFQLQLPLRKTRSQT